MNIYPSLISADLLDLGSVISECSPYCDGFHIDIMDNHFVPNLTWGLGFLYSFLKATSLPLYVHCMVDDPLEWSQKVNLRVHDYFIFHYEALSSAALIETIYEIAKKKGFHLGLALSPGTSIEEIAPFIHFFDHILLMTVKPGFSGQECIEKVFEKIEPAQALRSVEKHFSLSVDGGIKEKHLLFLKNKKIDGVAIASAIFASPSPLETLQKFYSVAKNNF